MTTPAPAAAALTGTPTLIDKLGAAIGELANAGFRATGAVVNGADWNAALLGKTTSLSGQASWEAKQAVPDRPPHRLEKAEEDRWFTQYSKRRKAAEQEIAERLFTELEEQLEACKNADEVEALLVRLDWPDKRIAEYMERFT